VRVIKGTIEAGPLLNQVPYYLIKVYEDEYGRNVSLIQDAVLTPDEHLRQLTPKTIEFSRLSAHNKINTIRLTSFRESLSLFFSVLHYPSLPFA
jgi:hypothetical protein